MQNLQLIEYFVTSQILIANYLFMKVISVSTKDLGIFGKSKTEHLRPDQQKNIQGTNNMPEDFWRKKVIS